MRSISLLVAACILTACPCFAGEFDYPTPSLKDARFQLLPFEVKHAVQGPDGRIWWSVSVPEQMGQVKRIIENAFDDKTPVLNMARPVYFEPNGRIWFEFLRPWSYAAYDGEKWIECTRAEPNSQLVWRALWARIPTICAVGKKLFLPADSGVYCWDEEAETMSCTQFVDTGKRPVMIRRKEPFLFPDVDHRGLTAFFSLKFAGPKNVLQHYRDGKWSAVEIPEHLQSDRISGLRVEKDGVWLQSYDRTLWHLPFDSEEKAERHSVREKKFRIGPYEAAKVLLRFDDNEHVRCLRANEITKNGNELGPGMILEMADGGVYTLLDEELAKGRPNSTPDSPIVNPKLGQAWVPVDRPRPPSLYDLNTGKMIVQMPGDEPMLVSALDDGTVITRKDLFSRLAAYNQNAEDTRIPLQTQTIALAEGTLLHAILPDGSVVALHRPEDSKLKDEPEEIGTIIRFNGTEWKEFPDGDPYGGEASWIASGRNGEVAIAGDQGAVLFIDDASYKADDLKALIAAHSEKIAAAFHMAPKRFYDHLDHIGIIADKAGNIWYMNGQYCDVFHDGRWIGAHDKLAAEGADKIKFMASLTDGSMMYISNLVPPNTQWLRLSYYAEMVGDDFVLIPAPQSDYIFGRFGDFRDAEGGLLVVGHQPTAFGLPYDTKVHRLTDDFEDQVISKNDVPVLVDKSGNIWFAPPPSPLKTVDFLKIQRNGEVAQEIKLQNEKQITHRELVSDRPGSVYIYGVSSVYHYTAENDAPADYTLKSEYAVDVLHEALFSLQYSKLGYLVAVTGNPKARQKSLTLIKLPENTQD